MPAIVVPSPNGTARRGLANDAKSDFSGSQYIDTTTALTRTINYIWMLDDKTVIALDSTKNVEFIINNSGVTAYTFTVAAGKRTITNTARWLTNDSASLPANVKAIVDAVVTAIGSVHTTKQSYTDPVDPTGVSATQTAINSALA